MSAAAPLGVAGLLAGGSQPLRPTWSGFLTALYAATAPIIQDKACSA